MYQTASGITYGYYRDMRFDPAAGRRVSRLVHLLPGQGCVPWLRTKGACCPFCRLPAGTRQAVLGLGQEDRFTPWEVSPNDYREMIDAGFDASDGAEAITCFNGGSFLTDREVPVEARRHLYRRFAEHRTAQNLMVESRPEFVRPDMLDEALEIIGDKTLTVAIGLESTDERIRGEVLKKFIGWKSFAAAVSRLKARGMNVFVYVFLGAPGLTDRAAYEDAERSVRRLVEIGVDEIALSCAFVPPGGPLEAAFKAGTFRPPWLWSIARLITLASAKGWPLSLGNFDDFPPPVAIPANCGRCDAEIHDLLDQYRQTQQFDPAQMPRCDCRETWDELMRRDRIRSIDRAIDAKS